MMECERPDSPESLRRWAALIGAGVFATTLAQPAVLRLPFQQLLKSQLQVSREAMAAFFAVAAVAWYVKPLAGILSDSAPLFGTRRRHYLLLGGTGASLFWVLVALLPRTYASVLAGVMAVNAMLMLGSTITGAVMVEAGQRYGATGRLTSVRYVVQSLCLLLGGPLGGWLATRPFELTALVGAASAGVVVPVALILLHEPSAGGANATVWVRAREELRTLTRSRALWSAVGVLAVVYVPPGFSTALYYIQTDTLLFPSTFIGTLAFISGSASLGGAALYGIVCKHLPLRRLLQLGILCSALATLCYLFYHSRVAAMLIDGQAGLFVTIAELALMDLAARATPRGSEGLSFALMMSVRNGALAISDITGSWLIQHHYLTFARVVELNAAVIALALLLVGALPPRLADRRESSSRHGRRGAGAPSEVIDPTRE